MRSSIQTTSGPAADLTLIGPHGTKELFRTLLRTLPGFNKARFTVQIQRSGRSDPSGSGSTKFCPRTVVHSRPICIAWGIGLNTGTRHWPIQETHNIATTSSASAATSILALLDCSFPANKPEPGHLHAGQCGQVAREAGATSLVLSHFYPIAERYDVRGQAGKRIQRAYHLCAGSIDDNNLARGRTSPPAGLSHRSDPQQRFTSNELQTAFFVVAP